MRQRAMVSGDAGRSLVYQLKTVQIGAFQEQSERTEQFGWFIFCLSATKTHSLVHRCGLTYKWHQSSDSSLESSRLKISRTNPANVFTYAKWFWTCLLCSELRGNANILTDDALNKKKKKKSRHIKTKIKVWTYGDMVVSTDEKKKLNFSDLILRKPTSASCYFKIS